MIKTAIKRIPKRLIATIIAMTTSIAIIGVIIQKIVIQQTKQLEMLLTPQSICLTFQNIYKPELKDSIEKFVASYKKTSLVSFSPIDFYQKIKATFPIIKHIEWDFDRKQNLNITIQGTRPYCLINNSYVLGDRKRLLSTEYFTQNDIATLPHLTVDNKWLGEKINARIFAFIRLIPTQYWSNYHITYITSSNISLIPHAALCRCRIVTTEKTFFDQKKFRALSSIFKNLCHKGLITQSMLNSKRNIILGFDFRIRNQIIVRFCEHSKGGMGL